MSLPAPFYADESVVLYNADCREVLPLVPPCSLVVTDPPYNGVLADDWDNQWESDADFLAWLEEVTALLDGVTVANASLYLFTSPRLCSAVEAMVAKRFRVIGSLVWNKGEGRKGAAGSGVDVTALRTYWSANTERVVFAEKRNGDDAARDASGYWDSCEAAKRTVIGDYLKAEFRRAGVTNKQVAALFPSRTGGMTGCVSNWLLGLNVPTPEQYAAMREMLNAAGGEYLKREYEGLKREYEGLKREYEGLKREYEGLRRPFFLSADLQWGDVWNFSIPRDRQHPAAKPLGMMSQIVRVSSRPGDLVLDPFAGSGTTLRAAKDAGRRAIGIERDERYCEIIARRMEQNVLDLGGAA